MGRSRDPHRLPPEGGAAECDFSVVHDDRANSSRSGSPATDATVDAADSGGLGGRQANRA